MMDIGRDDFGMINVHEFCFHMLVLLNDFWNMNTQMDAVEQRGRKRKMMS